MVASVLKETGKRAAGFLIARSSERFDYRNCIFILAHMRCGSTALANVICSRNDVSGYGEAHVRYDGRGALGRLALNQMRRGGWKGDASFLFDKILHSRHDNNAPPEFFGARAIFVVRDPLEAIPSIVNLYRELGREEYGTLVEAAKYYIERLGALDLLWRRFPEVQRVGLTHRNLVQDPETELARISDRLCLYPVLENRYASNAASRKGGGGDPLVSGNFNRIEPRMLLNKEGERTLDLPRDLLDEAYGRFATLRELFSES